MSQITQGMPASVSSQEAHRVVSVLSVLQVESLNLQKGNNLARVLEPVSSSTRSESCSLVSKASSFVLPSLSRAHLSLFLHFL